MTIPHTWRAALPGQCCHDCRPREVAAVLVLVIAAALSGEELLCAKCASLNARLWLLSDPTISTVGADASAQTDEARAGINSAGLSTNTGTNCDEQS